ncbi:hypothetical protein D3C87_1380970 [compost metagenome]
MQDADDDRRQQCAIGQGIRMRAHEEDQPQDGSPDDCKPHASLDQYRAKIAFPIGADVGCQLSRRDAKRRGKAGQNQRIKPDPEQDPGAGEPQPEEDDEAEDQRDID